MAKARIYFKIVCSREEEMAGAGLGYQEMFGNLPRYFWDRGEAQSTLVDLTMTATRDLAGTYRIQGRSVYTDGHFDDADDDYARKQLGLGETEVK